MIKTLIKVLIIIVFSILLRKMNKGAYEVYPSYDDVMMLQKAANKLKSSDFLSQNRCVFRNSLFLPILKKV